jgi:hypothetical protein
MYGRKDGQRRTLAPLPYSSLAEVWPMVRALLRQRLRHGYKMIDPKEIVEALYLVRVTSRSMAAGGYS